MSIATPSARTFFVGTWMVMPLALLGGVLMAPTNLVETFATAGMLGLIELFMSILWMCVDTSLGNWAADQVDGRRWLRACRAHQALLLSFAGFALAGQVCFFLRRPLSGAELGPIALLFGGLFVPYLLLRDTESRIEGHVRQAAPWNAVRDVLTSPPGRFPSLFSSVLTGSPERAAHVLQRATPAQLSALRPADLAPLLYTSRPDIRLVAVTACASIGSRA